MIVRKLRLQRSWSQEQLAQFSGLSVRTIQRIERGQNAGLESLKSPAAVFNVQVNELQQEHVRATDAQRFLEEQKAIEYVRDIKGFYANFASYVVVVAFIFVINWWTSPGYFWAWWVTFGWGIDVIADGLSAFEVINSFSANWEKKQVEIRLGRNL